MNTLLDTHFVIWIVTNSRRLKRFRWLEKHLPWGLSPISLLEIQFLAESGKLEVDPLFFGALRADARFVLDDPPFASLIERALPLSWTRDPFDRLLSAHSQLRRAALASVDAGLLKHHPLIVPELRR